MNDAETIAACKAVIRHELGLSPRADALAELAARLEPADRSQRPPGRAPAVKRLRATLRSLQRGKTPACDLDELTDDVRFLRLFDAGPWDRTALDKLMRDIAAVDEPRTEGAEPPKRTSTRQRRT